MEKDYKKTLENVGPALKKLRTERGYQQKQVAQECSIHPSSYSLIEKGQRNLYILEMLKLADFYGISLSDLAERIQQTPAELSKIEQLQLTIDQLKKENAYLKNQLATL